MAWDAWLPTAISVAHAAGEVPQIIDVPVEHVVHVPVHVPQIQTVQRQVPVPLPERIGEHQPAPAEPPPDHVAQARARRLWPGVRRRKYGSMSNATISRFPMLLHLYACRVPSATGTSNWPTVE